MAPWLWLLLYLFAGVIHFCVLCLPFDRAKAHEIAHLTLRQRLAENFINNMGTDDPCGLTGGILGAVIAWPIYIMMYAAVGATQLVQWWIGPDHSHSADPEHHTHHIDGPTDLSE